MFRAIRRSLRRKVSPRARLFLKPLESRWVPAAFTVNALTDTNTGTGTTGDLRYVLTQAALGGAPHTIDFSVSGTITLSSTLPTIVNAVSINGPGAGNLTISGGGGTFRLFNIDPTVAGTAVSISSVTLTSASSSTAGGLIANVDAALTVNNSILTKGTATGGGGAIATTATAGSLVVNNSVFTQNTATTSIGGAIRGGTSTALTVNNSAFQGNRAAAISGGYGGAIGHLGGATTTLAKINGSSFWENFSAATASFGGGAIMGQTSINLTIENSTIWNNTAANSGGGVFTYSTARVTINNSTIASNKANGASGGGGGLFNNGSSTYALNSTIVADNTAVNLGPDIRANTGSINANFSAIENTAGITTLNGANNKNGVDPALGAFQDNGGFTLPDGSTIKTIMALAGSVAISNGSNTPGLANDQRGAGFVRNAGGAVDIGAIEFTSEKPGGSAQFPNPAKIGDTAFTFTMIIADQQSDIDLASLQSAGAVTVTGPNFYSKNATWVSDSGAGKIVTVTFTIPAPDNTVAGQFDSSDNGTYTVTLNGGKIFDTDVPTPNSADAAQAGTFSVAFPAEYKVTNANDSGAGSLRQAIINANIDPNQDTITFDAGFFSTAQTITFATALETITQPVIINGAGANKATLTTVAAAEIRVINIDMATAGAAVSISGLTLTGGNATGTTTNDGGGINNIDAALTLSGMVILNNKAGGEGGGINLDTLNASLVMTNSVIAGNESGSSTSTTGADGGGINIESTGAVSISNSVIRENNAKGTSGDGGGIMMSTTAGSLIILNSTVSGNFANGTAGGGMYLNGASTITITNSTISGNQATVGNGGGVHVDDNTTVNINNSTIFGNFAANGGGIRHDTTTGNVNLYSTIVAGNNASFVGPDIDLLVGGTLDIEQSNISNTAGILGTINQTGSNLLNVDPQLGGLANNGGFALPDGSTIQTHLPADTSPIRNNGGNALGLTTDQRGGGTDTINFGRTLGGFTDIGSLESVTAKPTATAFLTDVTTAGGTSYTFTVVYNDAQSNIDLNSVNDGDEITITGPNFFIANATYVSDTGAGKSVTVTYTFAAPDNTVIGQFDGSDNGEYTVTLNAPEVFDTDVPTPNSVTGGTIGNFNVTIPNEFKVTNANDSGSGSLRQAIIDANADALSDLITFDPGFFSTSQTITLGTVLETISNPVTIIGPGADKATVQAAGDFRVMTVDLAIAGGKVSISGLRLTGGNATTTTTTDGGGINNVDAALTLNDMVITGNKAGGEGGGINLDTATASLVMNNSVISNNISGSSTSTTGADGGGINIESTGAVTINNSVIRDNIAQGTSADGGGIMQSSTTTLTITNTTISGNTASTTSGTAAQGGGAMYINNGTTVTITNSTISGNRSNSSGGAIHLDDAAVLRVNNTTIANNSAVVGEGGGINGRLTGASITIFSSIVAGNTASGLSKDINGVAGTTVTTEASNISNTAGILGTFTKNGFNLLDVDPLLLPLADNDGFTLPDGSVIQTHFPSGPSPVRNVGADSLSLTTDQRGGGTNSMAFPRLLEGGVDMGSLESIPIRPTAVVSLTDVTTGGGTLYTFTVVYSDVQSNIDLATIKAGDEITVTGPNFYSENATYVSDTGLGKSVTVTYTIPAPDNTVTGKFDGSDNGEYTVTLNPNQVFDTDVPTPNSALGGVLGDFIVSIPNEFKVTNANDSGSGSLRQAIIDANVDGLTDTITFDATFFSSAQTISLLTALDTITQPVIITGPGASKAIVQATGTFRVLNIDMLTAGAPVSISGLTLTGGNGTTTTTLDGGGINNIDAALTLTSVVITGNKAGGEGGGINLDTINATLTLINSVVSDNSSGSSTSTTGADGGGINVESSGAVTITNSVIRNNVALGTSGNGGGLRFSAAGTVSITNSTISGNTAQVTTDTYGGGGMEINGTAGTAKITIEQSTISGNSAVSDGGGIFVDDVGVQLDIFNSTIYGNTVGSDGGGIANPASATITLESTIVAGNFDTFPLADDFTGPVTITASLFGTTSGATITGAPVVGDPLLGALGDNGGFLLPDGSTIQTHVPLAGSPTNAAGSNSKAYSFDQRGGPSFLRLEGLGVDIGAVEGDFDRPTGTGTFSNVTIPGGATYTFTVVFTDLQSNIDLTTIIEGDEITVTGPNSYSENAIYVTDTGIGKSVTVTYTIPAPDNTVIGQFDGSDNGNYTVTLNTGEVFDTDVPTPFSANGTTLGQFNVSIANEFKVTNDNDSGAGSLRQAILDANVDSLADTITFNAAFFSIPRTIQFLTALDTITQPVIIAGPGADKAILKATGDFRVMNIDLVTVGGTVNITGLTFTGGNGTTTTTLDGGGINNIDAALTLNSVVVTGNKAGGEGGGINLDTVNATLNMTNSVVSDNSSGSSTSTVGADGGGINVESTGTVVITNSVIRGNQALGTSGNGGGIRFAAAGTVTIANSTISGNTANVTTDTYGGGGMEINGTAGTAKVSIEQSTISGNSAVSDGGGIFVDDVGVQLNIFNSTIFGNTVGSDGGGIGNPASATITLESTIVAGNFDTSPAADDFLGNVTVTSSLFGTTAGATISGSPLVGDPLLGPLADNGGFTLPDGNKIQTHFPADGSPVGSAGSNSKGFLFDQRGGGVGPAFPRASGSVDIGAIEGVFTRPGASATLTNVTISNIGDTEYTFTVKYSDEQSDIDLTTIDDGDEITVTGPFGYSKNATWVSTTGSGKTVTATYKIPAPDNTVAGQFDESDDGAYTVTLNPNQVFDSDTPTANSALGGQLGVFGVGIGFFTVSNTNDSGTGSLRQAIINANTSPGPDTITFSALFNTPQSINLTTGVLLLSTDMTLNGPAVGVTVNAGGLSRVMEINGAGILTVNIDDMTFTGGKVTGTTDGAGIVMGDESVTMTRVKVMNNTSENDGGGILINGAGGRLEFIESVLTGNLASDGAGGGYDGAGINADVSATVIIRRSIVSGNFADDDGGGLYLTAGGYLLIEDSVISGNKATGTTGSGGGGGIYLDGTFTGAIIRNSTISGNTVNGGNGGGIYLNSGFVGTLTIVNSTFTNNSATLNGGGIGQDSATGGTDPISIESTIVSGNAANGNGPDVFTNGTLTYKSSALGSLAGVLTPDDKGGNLTVGIPLNLGPLQDNGGQKAVGQVLQTHALLAGSPAINAGTNPAGLTTDQRGTGFLRNSGGGVDIGAFEIQAVATPSKVSGNVIINNGDAQRSRVTSLKVNFDNPISFNDINKAFTLTRDTGGSPSVGLNTVLDGSGLFVTITFTGGEVDSPPGNQTVRSLVDGKYTFTIVASEVANGFDGGSGVGTNFVLGSTSYVGGVTPTPATGIFRNFGDSDGDGFVGSADFLAFRLAFLTNNDTFDFDGANNVDATIDFLQFRLNFLTSV